MKSLLQKSRPMLGGPPQPLPTPLPPGRTKVQYAAITRYVTPSTTRQIRAGKPKFVNIDSAHILPHGQHLPPVPIIWFSNSPVSKLYPELARTMQQWAPVTLVSDHNRPPEDWHFDFAFWIVQGGKNPDHPSPWPFQPCPTAEVDMNNVTTLAVYDLNGGPPDDTAAWNIQAWHLDAPVGQLAVDAFHVLRDPSAAKDARANLDGLVDTVGEQEVEAAAQVQDPDTGETLRFHSWTYDSVSQVGRTLYMQAGTAGRARAWYSKLRPDTIDPFPNTFDPWWYIKTHGGLTPPPTPPPYDRIQREFNLAVALGAMAESLSAELRADALELAYRQATIGASSIKTLMHSVGKRQSRTGDGNGTKKSR
jgi:hypothetical protein